MPRPFDDTHSYVAVGCVIDDMGGSTSSSRRSKAVAKRSEIKPIRTDEEDFLDSSSSCSSDGEWDDLPPFPDVIGTTRSSTWGQVPPHDCYT